MARSSDRPARIIYIASRLVAGGPTNQLLNIVTNLDSDRFDPVVLTLSGNDRDTEADRFRVHGVPVESIYLPRLGRLRKGRAILAERIRSLGASLVHSQGIRPDCIASELPVTPLRIATMRNYPYADYPQKYGPVRGRAMALRHLRALQSLPCIVACSSVVQSRLARHAVRSTVIPNGVDRSQFPAPTPDERARLKSALGLTSKGRVFLSVGALIRRKDPLTLIRGFRLANSDSSVLILVGDGPLRASCVGAAGDDPRIRIVGQVTNVADYMKASDCFVSASRAEGMPNAIMEALSCGLPLCVSAIDEHREILPLHHEAGFTFPVGDANGLARLFVRIVGTDLGSASKSALGIARRFDAREMSQQYQALYVNLLTACP